MTESLSENQVPVKTAPSIAIAKELEEKVKAEIQNKVSFFLRFDIDSSLLIKPYHTHFTSNTQPSTLNLAPQKPDADLKRDVEKKLRKLARRTQRAIRELIRTSFSTLHSPRTHTHT